MKRIKDARATSWSIRSVEVFLLINLQYIIHSKSNKVKLRGVSKKLSSWTVSNYKACDLFAKGLIERDYFAYIYVNPHLNTQLFHTRNVLSIGYNISRLSWSIKVD